MQPTNKFLDKNATNKDGANQIKEIVVKIYDVMQKEKGGYIMTKSMYFICKSRSDVHYVSSYDNARN